MEYNNYLLFSWLITIFWIIVWIISICYVSVKKKLTKKKRRILFVPLIMNLHKFLMCLNLTFEIPYINEYSNIERIFPKDPKNAFETLTYVTFFQLGMVLFWIFG